MPAQRSLLPRAFRRVVPYFLVVSELFAVFNLPVPILGCAYIQGSV